MATLSDSKSDPTHKRKNPTLTNNTLSSATIASSSFLKSVFLHDWWLIKAHGKGLAVGGFTSTGTLGVKLFCSSAISKRHDANTLETTDGITITISGFINRSQTHQHGFPSEICNRFLIGFPYYWEEYAARYSGEESHNGCVPTRVSAFEEFKISSGNMKHSFLPVSLYDLPVTRTRDLLMSTLGDSEDCMITKSIFENLLGKFSDKAFQHTGVSNYSKVDTNNAKATVDSVPDETPSNHKKAKVKKHKDKNGIMNVMDIRAEESQKSSSQSKVCMDIFTPSGGVATRSMKRLMNARNNQDENYSLKKGTADPSSSLEATGKQGRGMLTKRSASNVSHGTILSGGENEVKQIRDNSALRRSSVRLKNLKN